ncbi:hypothetical protein [Bacillus wiedmannii]|uniref:hypothetical protein n=1 Tax=Bacillus wiedmannii TaxID=1890302 RepID=UPI000BFD1522|nr:hypothetical protein [Bacillus wiedmannii]PHD29909.1 hypothetical protein COF58_01020 [Bacillus wiedmannii]
MMLNRVIFKNKVYYKVADLAELFSVSTYRMRKAIKTQKITAKPLKGFGRVLFVQEENAAKIVMNNQAKTLKTEFTVDPVQETTTIETEKTPSKKTKPKTKKRKKSASKSKEVAVETVSVQECPVEDKNTVKVQTEKNVEAQPVVDEHQKECDELKEEIQQLRLKYFQATRSKDYNDVYTAYIGDGELDEVMADDLDTVRQFIEMLKLEFGETNAQAEMSIDPEPVLYF